MARPVHVASVPSDDCTGQAPTRARYLRQSGRSPKVYQRETVQPPPGAQSRRHLRHWDQIRRLRVRQAERSLLSSRGGK